MAAKVLIPLATGGEGQFWLNDYLKLGVSAYHNSEDDTDSGLYGANVVARMTTDSWLKDRTVSRRKEKTSM